MALTKETLMARREQHLKERDLRVLEYYALDGAIQELDHLLEELSKGETLDPPSDSN